MPSGAHTYQNTLQGSLGASGAVVLPLPSQCGYPQGTNPWLDGTPPHAAVACDPEGTED